MDYPVSMIEGQVSSPCLDCMGWQDMSLTEGRVSSPCLNCVGWQDTSLTVVRKIERPPLILTVLGGRTRAHLDNSSQASSPYLNFVGWQDKPTVELSMVLHVALSGCRNLNTATNWPVQQSDVGGQISPPYSVSETSHFFDTVKLASFLYCSVIVAWSIESRKTTKWPEWGWGWFPVKPDSFLLWHCTLQ